MRRYPKDFIQLLFNSLFKILPLSLLSRIIRRINCVKICTEESESNEFIKIHHQFPFRQTFRSLTAAQLTLGNPIRSQKTPITSISMTRNIIHIRNSSLHRNISRTLRLACSRMYSFDNQFCSREQKNSYGDISGE